jgi:arginine exporter protein ArgO
MIFIFLGNLMIFLLKKGQLFPFHLYFLYFCFIFKKRLIVTCVFECFQSIHILKKLHEFLCMMGAFFDEYSFIFNFVGYGWMTK